MAGLVCFLAAIAVFLTIVLSSKSGETRLVVVNGMGETIRGGEIEVCGEKLTFLDVKPGETNRFSFKIPRKSSYRISILSASGQNMTKELGYVTRDAVFEDWLIITDHDVILDRKSVKRN